jgi:hypothetical protein
MVDQRGVLAHNLLAILRAFRGASAMRLDMDLARQILLEIEKFPKASGPVPLDMPGRDPEEVAYHVKMMSQAGLVEALDLSTLGDFEWQPISLTWEGHQFLSAARDETTWSRAKSAVKDTTGGLAFELLKGWLRHEAKERLGLAL